MIKEKTVAELPEDIEVIGPGQMLADARKALGLTQQQVADKLNFRTSLVKDIEREVFDKSLPATFNRGYLKNYAKLVNISIEEVLASYEMLNVAQKQGAEMQSFSKQTEKQAEHSRLMWSSYLILAVLIGATIVWWLQDTRQNQHKLSLNSDAATSIIQSGDKPAPAVAAKLNESTQKLTAPVVDDEATVSLSETLIENPEPAANLPGDGIAVTDNDISDTTSVNVADDAPEQLAETSTANESQAIMDFGAPESVQFTFSGDCWVNIYDATGERIAWGIKKSGYVMNITGQAPFTITLGKPELVNILFEQQTIDMSQFSRGNIAKFTLPMQ